MSVLRKDYFKLGDITVDELEDIRRSVWKKAFKKRMDQNKEKASGSKDKYVWTSVDDYQFHGFKIRPPSRRKLSPEDELKKQAI